MDASQCLGCFRLGVRPFRGVRTKTLDTNVNRPEGKMTTTSVFAQNPKRVDFHRDVTVAVVTSEFDVEKSGHYFLNTTRAPSNWNHLLKGQSACPRMGERACRS